MIDPSTTTSPQPLSRRNSTTLPPFKEGFGPLLIKTELDDYLISPTASRSTNSNTRQIDSYQRTMGQYFDHSDNSGSYERTKLIHSAPLEFSYAKRPPVYNSFERSPLPNPQLCSIAAENYHLRRSSDTTNRSFIPSSPTLPPLARNNSIDSEYNTPRAAYDLTRLSQGYYSSPHERHLSEDFSGQVSGQAIALIPPMSSSLALSTSNSVDETPINSGYSFNSFESKSSNHSGHLFHNFESKNDDINLSNNNVNSLSSPTSKGKSKRKLKSKSKSNSLTKLSPILTDTPTATLGTIRLSQKRYSIPKPGEKPNTQGRPFTDSMCINLTIAPTVDDIFISCLTTDNVTSKSALVEFTQIDKNDKEDDLSPSRRSSVVSADEGEDVNSQKIIIDHNNIASGIRNLFSIKDFYFVQVVRSSTNQHHNVDRDIRSLPAQKLICIPCPENDDEITCKYLKQVIAHPRYKCNMKFYIVEGKLEQPGWNYTSYELMEQEKRQIAIGEITCPSNVKLFAPSDAMLEAINRRRSRRYSSGLKRKLSKGFNEGSRMERSDTIDDNVGKNDHYEIFNSELGSVKKVKNRRKVSHSIGSNNHLNGSSSSIESGFTPSIPPLEEARSSAYPNNLTSSELYNKMSMKVLIN